MLWNVSMKRFPIECLYTHNSFFIYDLRRHLAEDKEDGAA